MGQPPRDLGPGCPVWTPIKVLPATRRFQRHMIDRRTEPRLMCADLVEVEWKDALGQPRKCTGLLEDISAHGACLQLDDPLPLGTPLDIEYHKGHLKGSVSYCYFSEIGYWV